MDALTFNSIEKSMSKFPLFKRKINSDAGETPVPGILTGNSNVISSEVRRKAFTYGEMKKYIRVRIEL